MDFVIIILIIFSILLIILYGKANIEDFSTKSNEAVQNIASLYNTGDFKVENVTATNSITSPNINATNISVTDSLNSNSLSVGNSVKMPNTGTDIVDFFINRDGKSPYYFINQYGQLGLWDGSNIVFNIDPQGRVHSNPPVTWLSLQNSDLGGQDLGDFSGVDEDTCKRHCAGNPLCTHIVYHSNGAKCYPKNLQWNTNSTIGTKRPDNSFQRHINRDRPSFDYNKDNQGNSGQYTMTIDDCEKLCQNDSHCLMYSYTAQNRCYLKKPDTVRGANLHQKS